MAGIFEGRFGEGTLIPRTGGTGPFVNRFNPEIKIEEKPGESTKTTTILKPQDSPNPTELDLAAEGQAFNPMELWMKVSKIVDAEMITEEEKEEIKQRVQSELPDGGWPDVQVDTGVPTMPATDDAPPIPQEPPMGERFRNPGASSIDVPQMLPHGGWPDVQQDTGVPTMPPTNGQEPYIPSLMAGIEGVDPSMPEYGALPFGGWPDQQVDTGVPTTPPVSPDGPLPHHLDNLPPQGPPPGQQLPTYAPGNPHPTGGVPPVNRPNEMFTPPQGAPPGQPPVDPTSGQGVMSPPAPQDEGYPEGAQVGVYTPNQREIMGKAGMSEKDVDKAEAMIGAAANENDGTNNVGGKDASTDPMMWKEWGRLAQDPRARKAEYLKEMNMIILGGILLDGMADAMGVTSRSKRYMESMFAMMQERMKFDDQQRLYDIGKLVYWNADGTYNPPGSQAAAYDRAIQSGASVAEAEALSSKHPKSATPTAIKEYFKIEPEEDGTHKSIFIDSKTAPPPGYTGSLTNATGGKDPAAMRIEAQVEEYNAQADKLEAAGKVAEATAMRERAKNLLALGGGSSTRDEFNYTAARATFKDLYSGQIKEASAFEQNSNTFRNIKGAFIPWAEFRQQWLNSYMIPIMGGDGKMRNEPGWLSIKADPTQSAAQLNQQREVATLASIQILRDNPTPEMIELFTARFGKDQLPEEFK